MKYQNKLAGFIDHDDEFIFVEWLADKNVRRLISSQDHCLGSDLGPCFVLSVLNEVLL